jgi:hypothetical protein
MRNKSKLAILLFCICGSLAAQDTIRMAVGLEASFVRPGLFRSGSWQSLTFRYGRHQFSAGGAIVYERANFRPIQGVQAGYLFQPEKISDRFRLLVGLQASFFSYVRSTDLSRPYLFELTWPVKETARIKSLDGFASFGFRWSFHRSVYLRVLYGFGLSLYSADYTIFLGNGTVLTSDGPMELRPPTLNNRLLQVCLGVDLFRISKIRRS